MALTLVQNIVEQEDAKSYHFIDDTADYGAGGNPTSASITTVIMSIFLSGQTIATLLTFTVAANVISALTRTDPDTTVTNIFTLLTNTVFPFDSADPGIITGEMLGLGEDSQIPDGSHLFDYSVTDGIVTAENTSYELFDRIANCCIKKKVADNDPNCGCSDTELTNILWANQLLISAQGAACTGRFDDADDNIKKANEVCNGNCGC